MQTFLPYADFVKSAQCLDRARLGKQRVECLQLVNGIVFGGSGWSNHPCFKMWESNVFQLIEYGMAICQWWIDLGYNDSIYMQLWEIKKNNIFALHTKNMPSWFGDERLHSSHRSNLLRKDAKYYNQYGWTEPSTLPYWWPK